MIPTSFYLAMFALPATIVAAAVGLAWLSARRSRRRQEREAR